MAKKIFVNLLAISSLSIWSIITPITKAVDVDNDDCNGPRTPDELARLFWSNQTTVTVRTRPAVARVLERDPKSNPAFAPPETIDLGINIYAVKSLDQKKNEFEILVLFKQKWNDYRLDYSSYGNCYDKNNTNITDTDYMERFSMNEFGKIWRPDTTISNIVDEPTALSSAFWISPIGDVEYYQRLMLKLSCKFNFKKLPRDTQSCQIVVKTLSDDSSKFKYNFYNPPLSIANSEKISGSVEWEMDINPSEVKSNDDTVVFELEFQRLPDYYNNFVIIPVVLMVILGWTSFFIDRSAVPARITMSTTTFLTISNFLGIQLKNLPRISASDAWLLQFMLMSMIFTFYAVLEYIICNYLFRVEKRVEIILEKAKEKKKIHVSKQMEKANCVRVVSLDDNFSSHGKSSLSSSMHGGTDVNMEDIDVMVNKDDMLAIGLFKIDRLIVKSDGNMIIKDQHVEIFSRYAYPITYSILCAIFSAVIYGGGE